MNLLQYDLDFGSKRFRACELANANLSSLETMGKRSIM